MGYRPLEVIMKWKTKIGAYDGVDQLISKLVSEIPIEGMDELIEEMRKRKLEELEL